MSCTCTGNCDLISIENIVLSDTFHTWYDRTNEIIDAINPIQIYDVHVGLTDGGLTMQSSCAAGNYGGVVTLKVWPGPGIGVGTMVTPSYYLNHTMIDVSNMTIKGETGSYDSAVLSERSPTAFPNTNDWFIVSDTLDGSLGSGAGTPKRIKAQQILPQTVYLPYGFQFNGDISVNGNLFVQGTQSTIDSNNLLIEDKLIELGNHRLVTINVTGPTYDSTSFAAPGVTFYYFDPGVGNTAAYTTVGQISQVSYLGSQTVLKLHKFVQGGISDIINGGRISITGSIFDFTIVSGPTTQSDFYTDTQLDESGFVIRGSDSDKQFIWVYDQGSTPVIYNAFVANTNLGISGDTNAIISSRYKAFGYNNQNDNKFHFIGHNGAAPSIRLGGLGTGGDQYGYWGITRQNYGLTGTQQPLVFSFKQFAATGENTSFTIWSGPSGPTFATITAAPQGNNRVQNFAQGLNVDFLDGAHGTTLSTAWSIPIAGADGKIDRDWIDPTSIEKCFDVASHGFNIGDILRVNPDNGSLTGAIATSPENAEVLGMVVRVPSANRVCVVTKGFFTNLTAAGGSNLASIMPLVTGNCYFLSPDTQGAAFASPDTGANALQLGEVRKPLFVATNGNSGYFHNYLGVIEGVKTDVVDIQGTNPIGMILPFTGTKTEIPTGWLLCDGSRLEKSLYSQLFAAVGHRFKAKCTRTGPVTTSYLLIIEGGNRGFQVNDAVTVEVTNESGNLVAYNTYIVQVTNANSVRVHKTSEMDAALAANDFFDFTLIYGRTDTTTGSGAKKSVFLIPDLRSKFPIGASLGLGVTGATPPIPSTNLGEVGGTASHALTIDQIPSHTHALKSGTISAGSGTTIGIGDIFNNTPLANTITQNNGIGDGTTRYTSLQRGVETNTSFPTVPPYVALNWIIRAQFGLGAMVLTGHHHDNRYIRYDSAQTINSVDRVQFQANAKVLGDGSDGIGTFKNSFGVSGNFSSNLTGSFQTLTVTGTAIFGGGVNINGAATVNGGQFLSNVGVGGDMFVTGDAQVGGNLGITGNLGIGGTIIVSSDATLESGLDVANSVTLNSANDGTVSVGRDLVVGRYSYLGDGSSDHAYLGGNLYVTGGAYIRGGNFIVGQSDASTPFTFYSNKGRFFGVANGTDPYGVVEFGSPSFNTLLAVNGNINMDGGLTATGSLYASGKLQANGNVILNNSSSGSTIINGTLDAKSNVKLGNAASDVIDIYGAVTITGGPFVVNTTSSGALSIIRGSTVLGDGSSDKVAVGGTLTVTGAATFASTVGISGNAVIGQTTSNKVTIRGTLAVGGNTQIDDDAGIYGNLNITGNINVLGGSVVTSRSTVSSDAGTVCATKDYVDSSNVVVKTTVLTGKRKHAIGHNVMTGSGGDQFALTSQLNIVHFTGSFTKLYADTKLIITFDPIELSVDVDFVGTPTEFEVLGGLVYNASGSNGTVFGGLRSPNRYTLSGPHSRTPDGSSNTSGNPGEGTYDTTLLYGTSSLAQWDFTLRPSSLYYPPNSVAAGSYSNIKLRTYGVIDNINPGPQRVRIGCWTSDGLGHGWGQNGDDTFATQDSVFENTVRMIIMEVRD